VDPGEAISAVKALAKANAQGQRIYQITPANQGTTLPNIHHHLDTMTEIRTALAAGLEVITHTDAVSIPGWSETGYIILDPGTGSGAFKIGGGGNEFGLRRRKTGAIPGPASTDARRAEQATFEAAALAPRLREAQAGQRAVFFWTPPTLSMVCS